MTAYPNSRGEDAAGQDRRRRGQAAPRVLIALTNDSALSRAVQELVASGIEVGIVQTPEALSDELMQHASAVALIDCASIDAPVDALVDAIAKQFPELRLLVAGSGADQTLLATRIEKQTVFRFVHKPASAQRLKLFLDTVSRQSDTSRAPLATAFEATPFGVTRQARARTNSGGRSPSRNVVIGIGIAVVLAIGLGAWLFWPDGAAKKSASSRTTVAAGSSAPSGSAGDLVARADQAFGAGRYVATDGTSAAELYRDALKLDANNEIARKGYDRSIEYGLRSAEEALLANRVDAAAAVAETLRLLVPGNSRLAFLQAQIDRESARVNADASQRQAQEARQSRIRETLDLMNTALARGALLEPSRDNAVLHFRAAAEVGAADPAVRNARETLVAALLTAADNELSAQRLQPGMRFINAAASVNSGAPGLDVLRRRAGEMQAQAEARAAAAAAAKAAPEPPPEVAPKPVDTAPEVPVAVAESTLRRVSTTDPVYPTRALEKLVSGWVEMEFTVAPNGSVQDVVVTNAEPKGTFDRSAVVALKRWRYEPVLSNGEAVPQRARIRMRFTARDQKR